MKIGARYSHLNGFEWIKYRHPKVWKEITQVIDSIDADHYKTKVSEEKRMRGKLLYSPGELNEAIKQQFSDLEWSSSTTQYWVTDDYNLIQDIIRLPEEAQREAIIDAGKTPIRSYNQTDFVKNRIAVEVQFGKYSFIAYDLFVKHMAFFVGNTIDLGIEILPMKSMQAEMSSGPGYYEGALYDLARQGRGVPAVPLILVGVEP